MNRRKLFTTSGLASLAVAISAAWLPGAKGRADTSQGSADAAAQSGIAPDHFGVSRLHPTVPGGREWFADWSGGTPRTVGRYDPDPKDLQFFNEDGDLRLSGDGVAHIAAGMTRLVVLTPPDARLPQWRNVEMTIYVRRGRRTQSLDYQAFYLSARSGVKHNDDVPCDGTSYHSTARFDGQWGFKKELWHTGGYTALAPDPAPKPWPSFPENEWVGLKFVCRNCDNDRHVRLELYRDLGEKNDWRPISAYTDTGGWRGEKPGCDRAQDAVLTEARPAVYFRTDYVNADVKKFSVREIAPLP